MTPTLPFPARTIREQTGFVRSHPKALCQDLPALLRVTEFDYDLTNEAFVAYFEARTGYVLNDPLHPEYLPRAIALFANPAVPVDSFNPHWRITRAKLQDCWELFRQQEAA